jgi:archaellin
MFLRQIAIFLMLIFGAVSLSANNDTNWTKQFGTSSSDYGYSVAADSSGNIFVTGFTGGSLFGSNLGSSDIFLAKYDGNGNEIWKQQFGTSEYDYGWSVAADSSGNIFVTGFTGGSLFGSNLGGSDIFLTKYDGNGNQIWKKQFGTSSDDYGFSVAADSSGNIFVTGRTDGSFGGSNLGSWDIFLAKYDGNGNQIWKKQFGTSEYDYGWSVAADSSGNIFVTGETGGSLFGSNLGSNDIFLAKYDGNGNQIWKKQFGTSSVDTGHSVAADSSGNIFVTGETGGSFGGSNLGSDDIFLAKYDGNGNQIWKRQFGTSSDDYGRSVAADSSGNIFVTGVKSYDIFLAKYDGNGNQILKQQFGTSSSDSQYIGGASALTKDAIYLTGYTYGSFDGFSNAGGDDVFLKKFSLESSQEDSLENSVLVKNGWNLLALDVNLSQIPNEISIIWQFENEVWSAFSPSGEFSSAISSNGFSTISENLNSQKGTWFLSSKDTAIQKEKKVENGDEISTPTFQNLDGDLGWNLLGTDKTIPAKSVNCNSGELARVWKFDENWKLFVEDVNISQYPDMFDTIFANEGFWVKCK